MPARFQRPGPDYHERLAGSFRVPETRRMLARARVLKEDDGPTIQKLKRFIGKESIEIISFDLFETLVRRPLEAPADAYLLLTRKANWLTDGSTPDFAQTRLDSELAARRIAGQEEISLADIYRHVQKRYRLSEAVVRRLMEMEIELETRLAQPREIGRKAWEIAQAAGKRIIIASDMYLPEAAVTGIIAKCGYHGYHRLYLSSTLGVTKKSGGLFAEIARDLQTAPKKILHIGNNKAVDIEPAQRLSLATFYLPDGVRNLKASASYKQLFPGSSNGNLGRSVIVGLIANRLFDVPGQMGDGDFLGGTPFNLGYAALGPLLLGHALWLRNKARADGQKRLYFLSREGRIIKKVFDRLELAAPTGLESHYLYCSRRAVQVAALAVPADVRSLAVLPYVNGVTLADLLYWRFGPVRLPEKALGEAGFKSWTERLSGDSETVSRFGDLCEGAAEAIISAAHDNRLNYLGYLETMGLRSPGLQAVVDVGWRANMQGAGTLLTSKAAIIGGF